MELNKNNLHDLRQEYRSARLTEQDVDQNPMVQFGKWFNAAVDALLYEPNVMTLATADRFGKPTARIVLLKGYDENGFVFYTNYESKKGQDLLENPQAALVFFWPELERQVRIEGLVSKVDAQTSADYFHSRPVGSQIGAMASAQSRVLENRQLLEDKVEELSKTYAGQEIPHPLHWGGYLIEPSHLEFWQGRPSRLHDRIVYDLVDGSWIINRLAP
ncbi:pyridoxamine 5'-phosphate oxidase [Pedobacter africanus]|uniref:Pyridoxamine 5'-phosphate oxidase n=1 Tax=Pedobacter africanus TaxID=151894 RepID=A0ACC6KTR9_9SPHI|nr:pyridoxamine 5'-phosphate oxidase [Pedobacter africanus]MDR6782542.1 pyridoxamine 5'-phosphate oxidase [Pedobacter africanus]